MIKAKLPALYNEPKDPELHGAQRQDMVPDMVRFWRQTAAGGSSATDTCSSVWDLDYFVDEAYLS